MNLSPSQTLDIVAPNVLYGALLGSYKFKDWQKRVHTRVDLTKLSEMNEAGTWLLFANQFEITDLAMSILNLKEKCSNSHILVFDEKHKARVTLIHAGGKSSSGVMKSIYIQDLKEFEAALNFLTSSEDTQIKRAKLTRAQLQIVRAISEGKSNREIAFDRNVSVRAVENMINRALERIGVESSVGPRAKVLACQNYLQSNFNF